MYWLYSCFLFFFRIILGFLSIFDSKINRGISGRRNLFPIVEEHYRSINPLRKRILIHVSSFGELEQAKPVLASLRREYPTSHLHLTFFSPSGYENCIGIYDVPDLITYLPFDSNGQVSWFLDLVKPDLVLFVRYDLWHNFVHECHDRNIPMLLFSATFDLTFSKLLPFVNQLYRRTYSFINTICTVSERDKSEIEKLAIHARELSVAGDTRFDQVLTRKKEAEESATQILPDELLQKIKSQNLKVLVCGSIWENEYQIILPTITKAIAEGEKIFVILVPHEVASEKIGSLRSKVGLPAILLSAVQNYRNESILIVDSIGKLFELYQYASVAYVGGGFGSGVHNVLEPAVWGVPTIVGPKHERSQEIAEMIGIGSVLEIGDADSFAEAFGHWFVTDMARSRSAAAARQFVDSSEGATAKIMGKIGELKW
ncbi:MAG: glycosyltransferase N-terminal domain-containing protein [Ignavibacteriota bacterium]